MWTRYKGQPKDVPVVDLCLSPMLAKMLSMKLRRALKSFESQHGTIDIPEKLANAEGVSLREDW